jgi:NTE family protein
MHMRDKKIAVALGGGGARGFAHVGILDVLVQNGIPIDIVTGCSMGALVGGAFAAGIDTKTLVEITDHISTRAIFDFSLRNFAHGGLMKGDSAMKLYRNLVGEDKLIEDCDKKFAAIATDLVTGNLHVFDSGCLLHATRASMAIPGVFTPVIDGQMVLVDGNVLKRVPIQEARDLGADIVIAVDVLGSPWQDAIVKNAIDVVERAFLIMDGKSAAEENKGADFVIIPDLGNRTTYKFDHNVDFVKMGRAAAIAAMPELLALLKKKGIKI